MRERMTVRHPPSANKRHAPDKSQGERDPIRGQPTGRRVRTARITGAGT